MKEFKTASTILKLFLEVYCNDISEEEMKSGKIANCDKCGFSTPNGICLIKSFSIKNEGDKKNDQGN